MKDNNKNEEENEHKNNEENIRHKSEEKEKEGEGGGEGEGKEQTVKEMKQNSIDTPGADLILVGRVDGTVDLYQVQIP